MLGISPRPDYSGGQRGRVGDNPFIFLYTAKIRALGWKPQPGIREGIRQTLTWLAENRWIFEKRA